MMRFAPVVLSQPDMMWSADRVWFVNLYKCVENIGIRGGLGVRESHFSVISSICFPWSSALMSSLTLVP